MSDFFEINPEGSFMQEDNYSSLEGQKISPRNFVSRPNSTEKLQKTKSEIFEARLDLSPDTSRISTNSMINMKINYDNYNSMNCSVKDNRTHYTSISDFLANYNDKASLTLRVPFLNISNSNASSSGNSSSNNMILPSDNIEEIVRVLDQYFDTTDGISYEFSYHDCSWTVVFIDDSNYNIYYVGILQDYSSSTLNSKVNYYIHIKRIDGEGCDCTNFNQDIHSLFYETDDFAAKSRADALADMDNLHLQFLGPTKGDDDTVIGNRVDYALDILNNHRLSKYEMSEAISILLPLSSIENASDFFTFEVLLAVLLYLQSIECDQEMLLTSTRCVMIFYNLSSLLSSDLINPVVNHFLKVAVNEGTIYDQQMRRTAAKTIENLLVTSIDNIERKLGVFEWLRSTILIKEDDKDILISSIDSAKLGLILNDWPKSLPSTGFDGLGERTISGRN